MLISLICTQNIDALEAKTGLSYGLGEWKESTRPASPSDDKGKGKAKAVASPCPVQRKSSKQGKVHESEGRLEKHAPATCAEITQAITTDATDNLASTSAAPHSSQDVLPAPPISSSVVAETPPQSDTCTVVIHESSQNLPSQFQEHERFTSELKTASIAAGTPSPKFEPRPREELEMSAVTESSLPIHITQTIAVSIRDEMQGEAGQAHEAEEQPMHRPLPCHTTTPSSSPASIELTMPKFTSQPPISSTLDLEIKAANVKRSLTVPNVVPLHGTLESMHCTKCHHTEPLVLHLANLDRGTSSFCPKCEAANVSRNALGERSRGTGVMKVSVVLYGEEHAQAARVGEIAEKDLLKAARPDFLIVAGTTLRIPGVKKLVKELAKVIKPEIEVEETDAQRKGTGKWVKRVDPSMKVIYVNNEAPMPETVWKDVFDTYVSGDLQVFASAVRKEVKAIPCTSMKRTLIEGASTNNSGRKSCSTSKGRPMAAKKIVALAAMKKKVPWDSASKLKQSRLALKSVKKSAKAVSLKPPAEPKKPKEKTRPGWKGYVLVPDSEETVDFWAAPVDGRRRKRVESKQDVQPTEMSHSSTARPPSVQPTTAKRSCITAKAIERMAVDDEEPPDMTLYCYCDGLDDGRKMVLCDAEQCRRRWFHAVCLPSKRAPKGQFFCTECRPIAKLPRRKKIPPSVELEPSGPSTATSPPSLAASDVSTLSDEEEATSRKEEDAQVIPDSQSTNTVFKSDTQEEGVENGGSRGLQEKQIRSCTMIAENSQGNP